MVAGTAAAVGIDGVPNPNTQASVPDGSSSETTNVGVSSNGVGNVGAQTTTGATPQTVTSTPQSMAAKAVHATGKGLYKAGEYMSQHRPWKGVAYGLGAIAGNALSVRNFTGFG